MLFSAKHFWAVAILPASSAVKEYQAVFSSMKCSALYDIASNQESHRVRTPREGKGKVPSSLQIFEF